VNLATVVKPAPAHAQLLAEHTPLIQSLARATLTIDPAAVRARGAALGVVGETEMYVDLSGVVDLAAERQRLEKEIKRADEAIGFARAKLQRPDFTERAPAEIVAKERERLAQQEALRAKLVASLAWVE
jgi:valyl-tRNA synthetase